jgi:hypothetical protein
MTQGWLIIERLENWEVDAANKFAFFGLSNRYKKTAAEITQNDTVFCYVSSGISAFSDIRIVQETGLKGASINCIPWPSDCKSDSRSARDLTAGAIDGAVRVLRYEQSA